MESATLQADRAEPSDPAAASGADARRRTFHTLDGLRGIAALVVLFRHIPDNVFFRLTDDGHCAVDMFFILSGFVLANAYGHRLRDVRTALRFMVQRAIRLYPLYLLGTLVGLGAAVAEFAAGYPYSKLGGTTIVTSLLVIPRHDVPPLADIFPLDYPAWSLFFEVAVNLVFALIAVRLRSPLLAVALVPLGAILGLTAWYFGTLDVGYNRATFWGGMGRVGYTFFAGVAVHRVWASARWPRFAVPPWAAVVLLVAILMIDVPDRWTPWYDGVAALVAMPLLVLAAAQREPSGRLLGLFTTLGITSYPIFALHVPVTRWLLFAYRAATGRTLVTLGPLAALLWLVPIVAAAHIAYRYYDVPVRRWLTRAWKQRTA